MNSVSMPPHKLRNLWLSIGGLLVALTVFLSLTPDPPTINATGSYTFAHVLAYGTLMLWFLRLYPVSRGLIIAVGLIAMGILLELLQGLTGVRSSDYMDMVANTGGVMLGWLFGKSRLSAALEALERQIMRLSA